MDVTRSVRSGAAWLLGMGLLIAALVVYGFVTSRWACDEVTGNSFACDVSNIAVAIGALVAVLHLVAGAGTWRGGLWGVAFGAVVAGLGAVGSASLLSGEMWWLALPAAIGYIGTSLVLAYAIAAHWGRDRHQALLP